MLNYYSGKDPDAGVSTAGAHGIAVSTSVGATCFAIARSITLFMWSVG
jgi:hypothetical protein